MVGFSMTQEKFNAADTVIKIISLVALFGSGVFAWNQYEDGREREFKKTFYEKQLTTVDNLFEAMTQLESAKTEEERILYVKKFFAIHQGAGQIYFTSTMYRALDLPMDYVRGCVAKMRETVLIKNCKDYSGSQTMFGFAQVARKEISTTWDKKFSEIALQKPFAPVNGNGRTSSR